MDVLSFSAVLGLGVLLFAAYVIHAYFSHLKAERQTEALLLIHAAIVDLTSQLEKNKECMTPRGGGGSGEEPGKK